MESASKMLFKTEMAMRPAVLFFFCFAQIGSINGISGKLIMPYNLVGTLVKALLLKM